LLRPDSSLAGERPPLELYDIEHDPFEKSNLAPEQPDRVARMYQEYQDWFRDVSATRGFAAIPIQIGGPRENPTLLTLQDWRRRGEGQGQEVAGSWHLEVARGGRFQITVEFPGGRSGQVAHLSIQGLSMERALGRGLHSVTFRDVNLGAGPAELECWIDAKNVESRPTYVNVTRFGDG
jgi:hypothetical protein